MEMDTLWEWTEWVVMAATVVAVGGHASAEANRVYISESTLGQLATIALTDEWEFTPATDRKRHEPNSALGELRKRTHGSAPWRIAYTASGHLASPKEPMDANPILGDIQRSVKRQKEGQANFPVEGVERWVVPPKYSHTRHALEWALAIRFQNDRRSTVNYAIRVFTRRGYLSFDAAGPPALAQSLRREARTIVARLEVTPEEEYNAFDARTEVFAPFSAVQLLRPSQDAAVLGPHSAPGVRAAAVALILALALLIWVLPFGRSPTTNRQARDQS